MKQQLRAPRRISGAALAAALALGGTAQAAMIVADLNTLGPIGLSDEFQVNLSLTGWNAADGGVDSISFWVDYDSSRFEYVLGSGAALADGTEFLAEGQPAGYLLDDQSFLVSDGRFAFSLEDIGDFTTGSVGGADNEGPIGSFRLRATGIGAGTITPDANNVDLVFADQDLFDISPTGGVTFSGASITVVPEPAGTAIVMLSVAAGVACCVRRRKT